MGAPLPDLAVMPPARKLTELQTAPNPHPHAAPSAWTFQSIGGQHIPQKAAMMHLVQFVQTITSGVPGSLVGCPCDA